MTEKKQTDRSESGMTISQWIDRIADEFEAAWQNGEQPLLESYIGSGNNHDERILLKELVKIDLEYRQSSGQSTVIDEYLEKFPNLVNSEGQIDSDLIVHANKVVNQFFKPRSNNKQANSETANTLSEKKNHRHSIPKVIDRYQIVGLVGEGAFGVVYRALDTELNRTVAIKVPRSGSFLQEKDKERFQREAQSAATLNHPGIVKVLDIVLHGTIPYIVSEFIEGSTLADFINSRPISPRSAAKLLLKITEAIEHAHQQGLIHRDLKPTNILIDENGNPHITDFGLAKSESVEFTATIEGQILGTPAYMSPEQARGESSSVDVRMDIYSLGAIFYELLTSEKPFSGTTQMVLQQVQHEQPRPPRKINERIPKDLETICLKCLEKEPRLRFSNATDLVAEVHRFLRGDSILSRPVGRIETLWRWCKRNPVISQLVALVALSLVSGTAISLYFAFDARSQKQIADDQRKSAQEERDEAEKQKILEQLRNLRLNERNYNGWTDEAKTLLAQARAKLSRSEFRDQTVAMYLGIEATFSRGFGEKDGSSIAFDRSGNRLAIGGLTNPMYERDSVPERIGARVWDLEKDLLVEAPDNSGTGSVAFYKNQAVEFIRENESTLVLRTIAQGKSVRSFVLPAIEKSNDIHFQWAIGKDASIVAASALHDDGSRTAWIWDVDSENILFKMNTEKVPSLGNIPNPEKADARVAVSHDGSLVAVGTENGRVYIWNVADGSHVAVLLSSHNTIQSLAFAPKPGRHSKIRIKKSNVSDWMIAVGDAGGDITVWDLDNNTKISKCSGSQHSVYALTFNDDSTILATGGRFMVHLWDVATGDVLFGIQTAGNRPSTDYVLDLAFSPDGSKLVIAGKVAFKDAIEQVHLWKLQDDWGVKSLRGLTGPFEKYYFSRNGEKLAALCHQWQLGIWNTKTGVLENLFDVPQGEYVDNAAIAFSVDGGRIAYCGGTSARLWDLKSGSVLKKWDGLPPGLQDHLAFDKEGRLLSIRFETLDMKAKPFENDRTRNPFICRVRNLLSDTPTRSISKIATHFYYISAITISKEGHYFTVIGTPSENRRDTSQINGFDSLSGKKLWSFDNELYKIVSSQNDFILSNETKSKSVNELREFSTGKVIRQLSVFRNKYGRNADIGLNDASKHAFNHLFDLYRREDAQPFLRLGFDHPGSYLSRFNPDNSGFVWSDLSGKVYLCDFNKLATMLDEFRMTK